MLPYRAKNPPEHFPFCTIALFLAHLIVFGMTTREFDLIRPEVTQAFAVSQSTLSLGRLTSALFLHGSLLHLLLDLLGLWLFAASVEGRLRPWLFVPLYFGGGFASELLLLALNSAYPILGSGGAVLALAGAYLYLFPYSTLCAFYFWGPFNMGTTEASARPLALLYTAFVVMYGLLYRGMHGVGHLTHLVGFGLGYGGMFALGARRDSEDVSHVQAAVSDTRDYALLHFRDLETLMRRPARDMNLVMAYCEKAITLKTDLRLRQCLAALQAYSRPLAERADPQQLAALVLLIPASTGGLPVVFYLHLASRLESLGAYDTAALLYRRACDLAPIEPDTEIALFRLGQLMQNVLGSPAHARAVYEEMLRAFPNGRLAAEARQALQKA